MKRAKHIAVYCSSRDANAGGGIVYVLSLAYGLQHLGYKVTVVFSETIPENELHQRYATDGLSIRFEYMGGLSFWKQLIKARSDARTYDIVIYHSNRPPRINLLKESYILCDFPVQIAENVRERIRLATWRNVITNSNFTKQWVQRYWNRNASVFYPPVYVPDTIPKKEDIAIISIGRFNGKGRSKRQDVIINAFLSLLDQVDTKLTLHLAGYVQDKTYLAQLKKQAGGFPVQFYENVSEEKKKELLQKSIIYVHACGYQIDEEQEPENTEHYGIVVVEAMAQGCIPLVVGKAGPAEIVEDGINGFHWETEAELIEKLLEMLQNPGNLTSLGKAAAYRATHFSQEQFIVQLQQKF